MPGFYSPRYEQALVFAYRLHATQLRKGTQTPYMSHLMAVSGLVMENGGTLEESIAGLLHDAVEDQGGDAVRTEIRLLFGDEVTDIVNGCTDADTIPKPPWRARKEKYVAHLREATPSVRLVSACDKLHNARTILADYKVLGDELWSRFKEPRDPMLWYYRAVIDALSAFPGERTERVVEELRKTIDELERVTL